MQVSALQQGDGGARFVLADFVPVEPGQDVDEVVEVTLVQFAEIGAEQFAVAGHDHREWHADELDARRFGHGHGILLAGENRVVEFGFLGILGHEVREIDGDADDLETIVTRAAGILGIAIDKAGSSEIAKRSRGTPRIANRLLRRVRDYAQVRADGHIDADTAGRALDLLDVDVAGFDMMDRKLLLAVMQKFDGGPVGIDNLAAAIGEERGTIEDVIEPFLIQQGYLMRTPRGRMATRSAWHHFGLDAPASSAAAEDLFSGQEPDA